MILLVLFLSQLRSQAPEMSALVRLGHPNQGNHRRPRAPVIRRVAYAGSSTRHQGAALMEKNASLFIAALSVTAWSMDRRIALKTIVTEECDTKGDRLTLTVYSDLVDRFANFSFFSFLCVHHGTLLIWWYKHSLGWEWLSY